MRIPAVALGAEKAGLDVILLPITRRPLGPADILVKVEFCGVCGSDLAELQDAWGYGNHFPLVPGHEVVGRVIALGTDVPPSFALGGRVGIGCVVDSCRDCSFCSFGEEQFCREVVWTYNSSSCEDPVTQGGFSDLMVVNHQYVVHIPIRLEPAQAAPLLCAGVTAYCIAQRHCSAGQRVCVVGFGGVGHLLARVAVAMGAAVTVLSTSEGKREKARQLGAEFIPGRAGQGVGLDTMREFDVVVDTSSSGVFGAEELLGLLRTGGTLVQAGLPTHQLAVSPMTLAARRLTVQGSFIGGIAETQETLVFCAEHGISADVEVWPALRASEALQALASNTSQTARIVLDMSVLTICPQTSAPLPAVRALRRTSTTELSNFPAEVAQSLRKVNRQPWAARKMCIHEAMFAQVLETPEKLALVKTTGDASSLSAPPLSPAWMRAPMSYAALDRASTDLARCLVDRADSVGRARSYTAFQYGNEGRVAAVLLPCCPERVTAYLAVVKAGLIYAPVSLDEPKFVTSRRLGFASSAVCVTLSAHAHLVPPHLGTELVLLDALTVNPSHQPRALPMLAPQDPVHLILTSGTTGEPKGVVCDHVGSVLSHSWRQAMCPFLPHDVVGCNIFGIWDALGALLGGATVCTLPDYMLKDPQALARGISKNRVTRIMLTPSLLALCLSDTLAAGALGKCKLITLCGEVVSPALARSTIAHLHPHTRVMNLYSISECHDVAADWIVGEHHEDQSSQDCGAMVQLRDAAASDEASKPIEGLERAPSRSMKSLSDLETRSASRSVGFPAPFSAVYILDDLKRPMAAGEVGDVYVGGQALAVGYWRNEVAAATAFQRLRLGDDGVHPMKRVYMTGDRGWLTTEGKLILVGRRGSSVKIRGFMVEMGAVEAALLSHSDIAQCVVTSHKEELAAYVVLKVETEHSVDALCCAPVLTYAAMRAHLSLLVATHCIPTHLTVLDALPVCPATGKCDRSKLPPPVESCEEVGIARNHTWVPSSTLPGRMSAFGLHQKKLSLIMGCPVGLSTSREVKSEMTETPEDDAAEDKSPNNPKDVHSPCNGEQSVCPAVGEEDLLESIRCLFASALHMPSDCIHDDTDFFAMGGHSMSAFYVMQLLQKMHPERGSRVTMLQFISTPTPRLLATLLLSPMADRGEECLDGVVCLMEEDEHMYEHMQPPRGYRRGSKTMNRFTNSYLGEATLEKLSVQGDLLLISGAAGFLGAHVLHQLLRSALLQDTQIVCLVRTRSKSSKPSNGLHTETEELVKQAMHRWGIAGARLKTNLSGLELLEQALESGHLVVVECDVSAPCLGLVQKLWFRLASRLTTVVHCAGDVNGVLPYTTLRRGANVAGVAEMLRLVRAAMSIGSRPVRMHHVSSSVVLPGAPGTGYKLSPSTPLGTCAERIGELPDGYCRSKFVAERMLHNAAQEPYSVQSTIYRMGNIGPPVHNTFLPSDSTDATTPAVGTSVHHSHLAPFDMQAAMVAASVALRKFPATTPEWRVVWVPVDHIAAKIVACVETQKQSNVPEDKRAWLPSIVHVTGSAASEQAIECTSLMKHLNDHGQQLTPLDGQSWVSLLQAEAASLEMESERVRGPIQQGSKGFPRPALLRAAALAESVEGLSNALGLNDCILAPSQFEPIRSYLDPLVSRDASLNSVASQGMHIRSEETLELYMTHLGMHGVFDRVSYKS